MAFSYNLSTEIGQIRLELGDNVYCSGVRSDGSNFSDEELEFIYDREGTIQKSVIAACKMLARDWAKMASFTTGPRSEQLGKVSAEWSSRAAEEEKKLETVSTSFQPHRVDGYSEAAT